MGRQGITVVSWNVRGLSDAIRRRRLKQELNDMEWDILILQETKLKGFLFRSFDLLFHDCIVVYSTLEEGRGVGSMVVKRHLRVVSSDVDRRGRWMWCDVDAGKEVWRVVNV